MYLVCVEYDGSSSFYCQTVKNPDLHNVPFTSASDAKMELHRRLNGERDRLENATPIVGVLGSFSFSGVDSFGETVTVKGCVFEITDVE